MAGLFSQYHPLQCAHLDHRCGEVSSNICLPCSVFLFFPPWTLPGPEGHFRQSGTACTERQSSSLSQGAPRLPLSPHIPVSMQQPEGCLKHKPDPRHSRSWSVGLPPLWKAISVQPHPWPDSLPSSTFLKLLSSLGPCGNSNPDVKLQQLRRGTLTLPGMLFLRCLGFLISAPVF